VAKKKPFVPVIAGLTRNVAKNRKDFTQRKISVSLCVLCVSVLNKVIQLFSY